MPRCIVGLVVFGGTFWDAEVCVHCSGDTLIDSGCIIVVNHIDLQSYTLWVILCHLFVLPHTVGNISHRIDWFDN